MLYINPNKNEYGAYDGIQSTYVKGLLEFPESLFDVFCEYNGFVELVIDGEKVIDLHPNTEAWEAWKATQTETVPTPSEMEQLRADIDYIAIMTGVEL